MTHSIKRIKWLKSDDWLPFVHFRSDITVLIIIFTPGQLIENKHWKRFLTLPIKWRSFRSLTRTTLDLDLRMFRMFLLHVLFGFWRISPVTRDCFWFNSLPFIGNTIVMWRFINSLFFLQEQDGKCRKCACSDNIDLGSSGNCNTTTGECLKCLYNTTGFNCQWCAPEFHGNALNKTCTRKSILRIWRSRHNLVSLTFCLRMNSSRILNKRAPVSFVRPCPHVY